MCVLFFKALITLQNMTISDDIDGSPISYNIMYSDFTSGRMCGIFSIPAATCWDGVCQHTSRIASPCSPNDDISVSVLSTNILGSGPPSQPVIFSLIVDNDHSESLYNLCIATLCASNHSMSLRTQIISYIISGPALEMRT